MKEGTITGNKVVGLKQTLRAISTKSALTVYLADDADESIKKTVREACKTDELEIIVMDTMKGLGQACGIDREASTAATIKS